MQVYIFRILAEEEDTFLREIALSEDNTLLDFHTILTKSMKLDDKQLASFYITNKQWEKQREFTLMDMEVDDYAAERHSDEGMVPVDVMSNVHIGDIIEDPKQRMLYEYNFVNPVLFFISLVATKEENDKAIFPKILFSEGNIDIEQLGTYDEGDSFEDLMKEGYDEDDLQDFEIESEDDLYGDEFYGSDSFGDDDY
jgi:hypothetical protein